jgi:hypothetical protein
MINPETIRKILLTCLVLVAIVGSFNAQTNCCPYISPIEIIPTQPTTSDSVRIVTQTTTPGYGQEISYSFSMQGNLIQLNGCFADGMLTVPRTFLDTTMLGPLQGGFYTVNYLGTISSNDTVCVPVDSNSVTLNFEVVNLASIANEGLPSNDFSIAPNPVVDEFSVISRKSVGKLELTLTNALGQVCYYTTLNAGASVDIRSFPAGMYWIKIGTAGSQSIYKVFKN